MNQMNGTTPQVIARAMRNGNELIFLSLISPNRKRMMMVFTKDDTAKDFVSAFSHFGGECLADWGRHATKQMVGVNPRNWWSWIFPCDVNSSNGFQDILSSYAETNRKNYCAIVCDMQNNNCTYIEMERKQ